MYIDKCKNFIQVIDIQKEKTISIMLVFFFG